MRQYNKIVIKVGSNFIFNKGIKQIVKNISEIKNDRDVVLVSSGAVSEAKKFFSKKKNTLNFKELSSIGQPILFYNYFKKFQKNKIISSQILVSKKLNISLIKNLLRDKILPIINGNDADNVEDLMFNDNDSLSGEIAVVVNAKLLVIITDVEGVFCSNPKRNECAEKFHFLNSISNKILKNSKETGSKYGTGGMYTKLLVAKKMLKKNIDVYITNDFNDLKKFLGNKKHKGTLLTSKK